MGFFEPVDIIKNDYGEKQFVVTEEMVDDTQKRIAAFGFSQPTKLWNISLMSILIVIQVIVAL